VESLEDVPIFYDKEIKKAANLIDCIWFTEDFKYIPAVIEIEHSKGVTSGFTRMLKFKAAIPGTNMNFTIVAPDSLRNEIVGEANNLIYGTMDGRFMPYSTVRKLYGLTQKYSLEGIVERNFIESFMEKVTTEQVNKFLQFH
jgi:type II restriction enzyme